MGNTQKKAAFATVAFCQMAQKMACWRLESDGTLVKHVKIGPHFSGGKIFNAERHDPGPPLTVTHVLVPDDEEVYPK